MSEQLDARPVPGRWPLRVRVDEQRGQGAVLAIALVAVGVLSLMLLVTITRAALDRAQARTGADAAALAGAVAPDQARSLARANGVELAELDRSGDEIEVEVQRGGYQAWARVRRVDPVVVGTGTRAGLAPAMLAALSHADQLLGVEVPITSGYRSRAHQQRLWDNRHRNPFPVARPGRSRHETGLAVDVPSAFVPRLLEVAGRAGLCRPLPQSDPIHFELCGARR